MPLSRSLFSLCIFVLFLAAAPAQAQTTVEGTVTSGGEPLPGVNVRVESTSQGAATDADGRYRITGLEPGTYALVASAVGFETARKEMTLTGDETRQVDFALEETVVRGEEVVVTGTMRETYVKDSPVKVEVVTSEYLERQPTSNLMDVIGNVNGVSTQLNCGVCYTNAIRINGVEGANTAVLIDGMPIMGALANVYGLNGISPTIIDQVEIIKGPQSTLYGTQATGGVINIITKDPALTPTLSADVFARSTQEMNLNLAAAPELGRLETLFSGTAVYMDNYIDDNGDGFSDLPAMTRLSLFGKGALPGPDGRRMLDVAAKVLYEDRTAGLEAFSDDIRGSSEVYGESIYTRRVALLGDYRPPVFGQRMRLQAAYTFHDQDSFYGDSHYDAQQQIAYGQLIWDQPLSEASDLLLGGTLRYQTYDDNTPATAEGADRRFIPGVFAQGEATLGASLNLLGGLRLDYHGEHGLITAPTLSARYSPSALTTFRLNTGTGFRVVNVFTEDHQALTGAREVVFVEDLAPERSYSARASVQQILPFGANPLTIDVEGFYTYFTNKIIPDYDTDPDAIIYANLDGHSVSQGVALGLSQNFTALPLSYNAGLTLLDNYTEKGDAREALAYAPDYTGVLSATYRVRALELDVAYTMNLTGPKRMPDSYAAFGRPLETPAFTVHDLQLTREITNVNAGAGVGTEVYVAVENIFDYTQVSPLVDPETPFGPNFDTIYTYGPVFGRALSLGVRLNVR